MQQTLAITPAQAATPPPNTFTLVHMSPTGQPAVERTGVTSKELSSVVGLRESVVALPSQMPARRRTMTSAGTATTAATTAATTTYIYQCYVGTSPYTSYTPFSGRSCSGHYWVLTSNWQAIWHTAPVGTTSPLWTAVSVGYWAVQQWCAGNTATCMVIGILGTKVVSSAL